MMEPPNIQATRLMAGVCSGDSSATEQLLPLVYDELRALAANYLRQERHGHTLQPTALVHEAYLRLIAQTDSTWNNRAHFFAVAARAMRNILVNHALANRAQKRGGGRPTISLDHEHTPGPIRQVEPIALDEALRTLATLDDRKARVVELRFFGGLTVEEVAEVLNVSVSTIEGDWRMAKAWLSVQLSEK
jgi:RNA polymerase sigma factor (TIGR02999 family)